MKEQQVSDFIVKIFQMSLISGHWMHKGCVEAYGMRGSIRDAWRPAYGMRGSLRELAH